MSRDFWLEACDWFCGIHYPDPYCHFQVTKLTKTKRLWFLIILTGMNNGRVKLNPFFQQSVQTSFPSIWLLGGLNFITIVKFVSGLKSFRKQTNYSRSIKRPSFQSACVLAGDRHINHGGQLPPILPSSLINSLIWVLCSKSGPDQDRDQENAERTENTRFSWFQYERMHMFFRFYILYSFGPSSYPCGCNTDSKLVVDVSNQIFPEVAHS